MQTTVRVQDVYEMNPHPYHRPGDIWSGLPTFGLLPSATCTGVVITPACDLARTKSETLTYLPIIPIRSYFCLPAATQYVTKAINGQLTAAGIKVQLPIDGSVFIPDHAMLTATIGKVSAFTALTHVGVKERSAAVRAQIGLNLLTVIVNPAYAAPSVTYSNLAKFIGGKWSEAMKEIVGNSWSSHLHLLPADEQHPDWTGISEHSVVLFRYPMTLPIEIMDCAQDPSCPDWPHELKRLSPVYGVTQFLDVERPLKRLTMKKPFAADLLSRYIGLYVRLGAPDFAPQLVSRYVKELGDSSQ